MFLLRSLLVLAALWTVTGCEINRVLTIKPDGSGQITERFLAAKDSFEKEKKPDEPAGPPVLEMKLPRPTKESVAKDAAKLGDGVKLTSFKAIESKEMMGFDAVYEFADVTRLHADAFMQQEDHAMPGQNAPHDAAQDFKFTKGAVSELQVPIKPRAKDDGQPGPEQAGDDPSQREAFIEAIKHLHIRMSIGVQGTIKETNAHYRQDNEIVLSEMNLKGMSADPKFVQDFKDAAAGKKTFKEPPPDERYIKRDEGPVVKIRFK